MSTFSDMFASLGWPALKLQFGDSATYTPTGGSATAVDIAVENRMQSSDQDTDRLTDERSLTIIFAKADIGGTVTPEEDFVTFEGDDYLLMKVEKEVAGIVTAVIEDLETAAVQIQGREYRR